MVIRHLVALAAVLALAIPAGAMPAGDGPAARSQPTNGKDTSGSGRYPPAASSAAAARDRAVAAAIRPVMTPMAREVKVVVDSTSAVLDSLRFELAAAAPQQASDLRAEIVRVAAAADLRILGIQRRFARAKGCEALVRQIDAAIARYERSVR
jgi:hypothetical protein